MTDGEPAATDRPDDVRRRRRGADLENALLTAAWDELASAGFARMTMESVAERARTGVAVLYRRWANKNDLVLAAIRHYGDTHPVVVPDTGTLRDDLVALLGNIGAARMELATLAVATFAGLHESSGLTPEEVRRAVRGGRPASVEMVFRRAQERGEIDLAQLSPAVLDLPFQLVRHDILMTGRPVASARVQAIVDDLFLPLAGRSAGSD